MAKTLTTDELFDLVKKARKGSTAAFGVSQWITVFQAIGWTAESTKDGRMVVGMVVTTPDNHTIAFRKEPHYKHVTFYKGTFDGEVFNQFGTLLKEKTTFEADVAKLVGEAPSARDIRRPHAPTCPVCTRDILLTEKQRMVHHGYQRPGVGYILGDCFGVDYEPWEVSPQGAIDFLARILRPTLARHKARLADLLDGKVTSFTVDTTPWRAKVKTEILVTAESDAYEFERLTKQAIKAAEQNIKQVTRHIAEFETRIAEWKAQPLPEYIGPVKVVHLEAVSRKYKVAMASCMAYAMMRPKYAPTTTDRTQVTCKRCLKEMEAADKRVSAGSSSKASE